MACLPAFFEAALRFSAFALKQHAGRDVSGLLTGVTIGPLKRLWAPEGQLDHLIQVAPAGPIKLSLHHRHSWYRSSAALTLRKDIPEADVTCCAQSSSRQFMLRFQDFEDDSNHSYTAAFTSARRGVKNATATRCHRYLPLGATRRWLPAVRCSQLTVGASQPSPS